MISDKTLLDISKEYGTQTYVFDAQEALSRAGSIHSILNDNSQDGCTIGLCYSIKANPFLIPVLGEVVEFFEVCSPGELEICIKEGVPGRKIIYSGVHKEAEDISRAVEYGAAILTAESIRHYELIKEAAKGINGKIGIILRLTSQNQFGMSQEDLEYIIRDNKDNPDSNIVIEGIHYFAGTQREKLKHQKRELQMLKELIVSLRERFGIALPRLEYGPGLAYPYFADEDSSDTLRPLKELAAELRDIATLCELTVEMGRFLASSCGYYLTRICDIKSSSDNNWCIVDGGINHVNYLGSMMGLKVPHIRFLSADARKDKSGNSTDISADVKSYTVCGSLCTANDVLVRSLDMHSPQTGDVLAFENIGAYSVTEGIYLFLSRTMPTIVIFNDGKIMKIRDRIEPWHLNCR